MSTYLVVNSDGLVENAIEWDGETEYDPGEGCTLEAVDGKPGGPWVGWTKNKGKFVAPPAPPVDPGVERRRAAAASAAKKLAALGLTAEEAATISGP